MGWTKKWERFCHLDESEYWNEICAMDEDRLRQEHKIIQQNIVSSGAAAGASGVLGFYTLGVAWAGTAVAGRRYNVNTRQLDMINRRLDQKGWSGHDFRKRDFVYSAGPCVAAELLIPAGGSILGHAGQAAVGHAAQHATTTASQHVLQAAGQHTAQVVTQHTAVNLVSHHAPSALGSVAHHGAAFVHSAAQGAQSELFTITNGALGHQVFYAVPVDLGTAQAQVLGAAAGQMGATKAAKEAATKIVKLTTKASIRKAIELKDRQDRGEDVTIDAATEEEMDEIAQAAILLLIKNFYISLQHYENDGTIKEDISRLDSCTVEDCECADYDDKKQDKAGSSPYYCICEHAWSKHTRTDDVDSLVGAFCEHWYARFGFLDVHGQPKERLSQVDTCEDDGCPCFDYDRDGSCTQKYPNCKCGHNWGNHKGGVCTDLHIRQWILQKVGLSYTYNLAQ